MLGSADVPNLIAGCCSGLTTDSILYPLDTFSTRLKLSTPNSAVFRTIYKLEGIRGFYHGLSSVFVFSAPNFALYFASYEFFKRNCVELGLTHNVSYLLSGAAAELLSSVVSSPMELIKSRLQLGVNPQKASGGLFNSKNNYDGALHAIRSIYKSEGMAGFYHGYQAHIFTECLFSALQFFVYENTKKMIVEIFPRDSKYSESVPFVCGCLAGATSSILTNPFDLALTRLFAQGKDKHYKSLIDCIFKVCKASGCKGLMAGVVPRTIHLAPHSALSLGFFEYIQQFLTNG